MYKACRIQYRYMYDPQNIGATQNIGHIFKFHIFIKNVFQLYESMKKYEKVLLWVPLSGLCQSCLLLL